MVLPGVIVCEEVEVTVTPGEFIWERGEDESVDPYNGDPGPALAEAPWTNERVG